MKAKYIQCECGQVLAVPANTPKVRCSKCGVVLRADAGAGPRRGPDRGKDPRSPSSDPRDGEDDGGEYQVASEAPGGTGHPGGASSGTWVSHVPTSASSAGSGGALTGGG